jgi:hypothetical protein
MHRVQKRGDMLRRHRIFAAILIVVSGGVFGRGLIADPSEKINTDLFLESLKKSADSYVSAGARASVFYVSAGKAAGGALRGLVGRNEASQYVGLSRAGFLFRER